ncbi:MAG: ABC transporter ATP-binding protein [Verrucomicrobiota bacterium]|jgi:oligopeptide/dipeptide ABC transporter ATP-binding protein|nr:ABC transporter ATP-binding protein [Verrucomicrobiota bacterium]MDD8050652.1 ABC transporter ATP-binding protein [Verrucomicrobiota bacterium]MDI9385741.1 ABC transporter ATP-binding protein [Verrucomicrobiota bacterium]HCF93664.1 ABC transporter ATP-binding protein [Verrucomicrobiota bacterium]
MGRESSKQTILEIRDLEVQFATEDGAVRAVDGVSLSIGEAETLALVGESGCGKSVTALSIARLVPEPPSRVTGGSIMLEGVNTLAMNSRELRSLRGAKVAYVFQEPGSALNPVFRVGDQIGEAIRLHRDLRGGAVAAEVLRLLKLVGIPAPEARMREYPHQLSGGMQQRVMIAMALASRPRLLVADEPTTALDVTIQAQILSLLLDLKERLGMAMLLITHNLGVVAQVADRVAVMYAGRIVEEAPVEALLRLPRHPYTRGLLDSIPKLGLGAERLSTIGGSVPHPGEMPPGCKFAPRCSIARAECHLAEPALEEIEPGRKVRCPFWKSVS